MKVKWADVFEGDPWMKLPIYKDKGGPSACSGWSFKLLQRVLCALQLSHPKMLGELKRWR